MASISYLLDIIDRTVKFISLKVARLSMDNLVNTVPDLTETDHLRTTVIGDYDLILIFHADKRVMQAIAQNMKRNGKISEDDLPLYMTEFFNILCGNVVSTFNNQMHTSARFGIPQFYCNQASIQDVPPQDSAYKLYYKCCHGYVTMQIISSMTKF